MYRRKDALTAAADCILKLKENCLKAGEPAVITSGIISAAPASKNIVPGSAYFSIDMRYHEDEGLDRLEEESRKIIQETCGAHGVEVSIDRYWKAAPMHFDEKITACIEAAATENKLRARRIISGAGHDEVFISIIIPTGMIFAPSINGMSHCPRRKTPNGAIWLRAWKRRQM